GSYTWIVAATMKDGRKPESLTSTTSTSTHWLWPEAISLVLGLEGTCIHDPAKKIQQSREPEIVDGYRAHSIIINFNCNNI
nr:hypothetical protein [Tanacetum cinerariifolium]